MIERYPYLAQKLFNTPLLIQPQTAEIVMHGLADRLGVSHLFAGGKPSALAPGADRDDGPAPYDPQARYKPYPVIDGVAIIQVEGVLVQKSGSLCPWSGITGYDGIRTCFIAAVQDADIKAIVLQIDSPGGELHGCFDLADTIFACRGRKPIWAVLDESACAAAYALASAADTITIPRTGSAGSIGLIAMLIDLSGALSQAGIKVKIIKFGARKADGCEFEPLPAEARKGFQNQINAFGRIFVQTVARNRRISSRGSKHEWCNLQC